MTAQWRQGVFYTLPELRFVTASNFLRGNNPGNCARLRSTPRWRFLAWLQELAAPTVEEGGDTPNSLGQNKETPKYTFQGASIVGQ